MCCCCWMCELFFKGFNLHLLINSSHVKETLSTVTYWLSGLIVVYLFIYIHIYIRMRRGLISPWELSWLLIPPLWLAETAVSQHVGGTCELYFWVSACFSVRRRRRGEERTEEEEEEEEEDQEEEDQEEEEEEEENGLHFVNGFSLFVFYFNKRNFCCLRERQRDSLKSVVDIKLAVRQAASVCLSGGRRMTPGCVASLSRTRGSSCGHLELWQEEPEPELEPGLDLDLDQ